MEVALRPALHRPANAASNAARQQKNLTAGESPAATAGLHGKMPLALLENTMPAAALKSAAAMQLLNLGLHSLALNLIPEQKAVQLKFSQTS